MFKSFLKPEESMGKKLVKVVFFAALIVIVLSQLINFVNGIILCTRGAVWNGIVQILSAPVVCVFEALVARVLSDFFCHVIDIKEK